MDSDAPSAPDPASSDAAHETPVDAPPAFSCGIDIIREQVKTLPNAPGVYRMLGTDGSVLYVGKARNLKKRVQNYARGVGHTTRIARMIALTASMVVMTTQTETEALLLETNLIKQLKPRFNVLMRDDKSFPYILLTEDARAPLLTKHRGARAIKGQYYGPFASVWAVNRTLNALQRAFLLRSCEDSVFDNRTRPCLMHQIKRCSAPCTGEISQEAYAELASEARAFLSGKSRAVRARLAEDMQTASDALEFERAARLRDRIAALSAIQSEQGINPQSVEEADVFAITREAGQFCVEVFFFRAFQNWGNRAFFPRADASLSESEVLEAFIAQFYDGRPAPRLVLLSHAIEDQDLLTAALSERMSARVDVLAPKRGEKAELVAHALSNAKSTLSRKLSETAGQERLLAALGAIFAMSAPPRRVEVYDNAHISGTNAVGAMVVAGREGFMKAHYRLFTMQDSAFTPGDDFAMMAAMLKRRFTRGLKEAQARGEEMVAARQEPSGTIDEEEPFLDEERPDADAFPILPDLVLIDGGKGQLEAAKSIIDGLGLEGITFAAVAKGAERNAGHETFYAHVAAKDEASASVHTFKLKERDPALFFIQRLRDEAHRFANGAHRAKRSKALVKSPLDDIVGIGPARKRALLKAFGTAKALARASLADLEKVEGINFTTAQRIYDHFRTN